MGCVYSSLSSLAVAVVDSAMGSTVNAMGEVGCVLVADAKMEGLVTTGGGA